jgi:hypothetical protein
LASKDFDQLMGSMVTTSTLGRWSLEARARRLFLKGNAVGEARTVILFFLKIRTQIRVNGDLNLGGWIVHPLP